MTPVAWITVHRPHPRPSALRVVFRVPVAAALSMLLSLVVLSGVGSARSGVVTAPLLVRRQAPQGQVLQTQVPQRHAVVVSDSILLGAEAQMTQRLRASGFSITFDASVSRSTLAGAGAVQARRAETTDTLIVSLGANDSGNPSTFRQRVDAVMAAAAHVPNVHWLTIREVRSYYGPANQVLRDASARYPNLHLVDWNAATLGRSDLTGRDGLHLNGSGAALLADLVTASVTGAAPPSATAPVDPTAAPVVSGPSPGSAPVGPAPVATPTPAEVAGPSEATGPPEATGPTSSPELDRNWFVSGTDDVPADDVPAADAQAAGTRAAGARADGEVGAGARVGQETSPVVAVLAVAALPVAVVPVAVLLVAAVLTAAAMAAVGRAFGGAVGVARSGRTGRAVRSVPEASITRAQLRAARIAGARERHPTVAVVPAVPDELVSPVPNDTFSRVPGDPVSLQS